MKVLPVANCAEKRSVHTHEGARRDLHHHCGSGHSSHAKYLDSPKGSASQKKTSPIEQGDAGRHSRGTNCKPHATRPRTQQQTKRKHDSGPAGQLLATRGSFRLLTCASEGWLMLIAIKSRSRRETKMMKKKTEQETLWRVAARRYTSEVHTWYTHRRNPRAD